MKDFIEALKKHGYPERGKGMDDSPPRGDSRIFHSDNTCDWWMFEIGGKLVTIYDNGNEQPDLLVACLKEVERLGWMWMLLAWTGGYECNCDLPFTDKEIQGTSKTKTKACCNALLEVLEASR